VLIQLDPRRIVDQIPPLHQSIDPSYLIERLRGGIFAA
jgi:hypothetical protein